jgi:hypothetical protein
MAALVVEAKNRVDGRTYRASLAPKHQVLDYWLAPTVAPGDKQPQHVPVTLTATVTRRPSLFALREAAPLLIVAYGIGRVEFDAIYALVLDILSVCDFDNLRSEPNRRAIEEICGRRGLLPDHGETRSPHSSKPIPLVMLFDRDATARGY